MQSDLTPDLHVAIPAEIVSYDSSSLTATIRVQLQRVIRATDEDDEDGVDTYPDLADVPVMWPGAGNFSIHFPLSAGDTGILLVCDAEISGWWRTGERYRPAVPSRHTLAGAVFLPMTRSQSGASSSNATITPHITITSADCQVGGTEAIAKSAALDALNEVFTSWTPVPNDGGAALKALLTPLVMSNPAWLGRATQILKGG